MSANEWGADDDDDCGDEFVGYNEWAVGALGVALFTDFVYDYEDGERGVFVAEDIAPQTRVLSVPFASLLTLEWLRAQAASGHEVYGRVSLFRALAEAPPGGAGWDPEREDDLLALALLYERFVARADSHWRPHLELLPESYDNLLYFTSDEIQRLRGSSVFLIAQQVHTKVREDYERLSGTVLPELVDAVLTSRSDITRDELEKSFSIDQYKWALSTIWSRFVSLQMEGKSEVPLPVLKAMAPVFDMLNHDPYAEISHGYNAETHALEVVTHQHVAAGTQLCIHYGAVSNHKLLTLYGFVVPGNPYNTMEFWLPMDEKTTTMFDAKARLLLELGIDHEVTAFELSAMNEADVDPAMLLAARVMQLECENENELAQCVEKIKFGEIVSDANEARALGMLIYKLETMLEQYTGDDSDYEEGAFEKVEPGDERRRAHHLQMIKDVRESDRLILENTIDVLEAMMIKVLPARLEKPSTTTSPTQTNWKS